MKTESSATEAGSKYGQNLGASGSKHVPSFLENRPGMKSSLFMADLEGGKQGAGQYEGGQQRRLPRMSEQPDMKFSHMEFGEGHKVPSFLQK